MIRCACGRDNRPGRRYCGACGHNLEPRCARCDFDNGADDRFCGGCGLGLRAVMSGAPAAAPVRTTRTATGSIPVPSPAGSGIVPITRAELDELLARPEEATHALPDGAIAQDDLDKLFGGA